MRSKILPSHRSQNPVNCVFPFVTMSYRNSLFYAFKARLPVAFKAASLKASV